MNMVFPNHQLDHLTPKICYNLRYQLFQPVGNCAGKHSAPVFRTPDTMILKEVCCMRSCSDFVHVDIIHDRRVYVKQSILLFQLLARIPPPAKAGGLLRRVM